MKAVINDAMLSFFFFFYQCTALSSRALDGRVFRTFALIIVATAITSSTS